MIKLNVLIALDIWSSETLQSLVNNTIEVVTWWNSERCFASLITLRAWPIYDMIHLCYQLQMHILPANHFLYALASLLHQLLKSDVATSIPTSFDARVDREVNCRIVGRIDLFSVSRYFVAMSAGDKVSMCYIRSWTDSPWQTRPTSSQCVGYLIV